MKIIFICTKSITFNKFLKSQADYLIKKGFEIKVACSDSEKLNVKNNIKYKINFPQKTSPDAGLPTGTVRIPSDQKIFYPVLVPGTQSSHGRHDHHDQRQDQRCGSQLSHGD